MHYSKFIYTAVLSLLGVLNYSTLAQELPTIIPPSPEASQLAKFVDTPVSLYKGTPNISIPLYEIKVDGVSVPISISYHPKGILVSEIASRVGLGWALNAGGAITRQVRDKADEITVNTPSGDPQGYIHRDFTLNFETDASERSALFGQSIHPYEHNVDLVPDLYMFNFLGFSGKFIIDHVTKKPLVQKYEDLEISPNLHLIKDNLGNQYYFAGMDRRYHARNYTSSIGGTADQGNDVSSDFINAWYLTKIITVNKKEILFNYVEEWPRSYSISTASKEIGSSHGSVSFSNSVSIQNQLESIVYPEGSIHFVRSIDSRQDIGYFSLESLAPHALHKVVRKDKKNI
jgi:hypothetical protein